MLYFLFILFVEWVCCAQNANLLAADSMSKKSETKLKWNGDLRVRAQNESNLPSPGAERFSQKLRLRVGVKADVSADLRAEIRLATAQSHNSTNQTLGDNKEPGMRRRFIGLDLAYAAWTIEESIQFYGGRIMQVHNRPGGSQILLDSDIALEGGAVVTESEISDSLYLRSNWGSAWLRENYDTYYSQEATDNMLNWGQVELEYKFQKTSIAFGTGFFNFVSLQGKRFSDISTGATARGNSQSTGGIYSDNYIPRQYYVNTKMELADWKVGVFGEYIDNSETRSPNRATWIGFSVAKNQWLAQLAYADIQSDAVPGIFTDSDFAGGSTDSNGYVCTLQWKLMAKVSLSATQFWNYKQTTDGSTRYDRTHLDIVAQF